MIEVRQDIVERRFLAAPPGGDGRQFQRLAQQSLRNSRDESEPRRRFEHTAAKCVREYDLPTAHSTQESRHTEGRIAPQLDRVAIIIVEPPVDRVHTA
jgi:hypothetical protein